MINKENFITAYFIDQDRKNIEILLRNDAGTAVNPHIIEYDQTHPHCQELLKICPLDQLHENTWQKKKDERGAFEREVLKIAEDKGLLDNVLKISKKAEAETYFKTLFEFLLSDNKDHIDRLFNFKLFIFEQDVVKKSKNEKAKSEVRKAKTPLGAFKEFIKIWEESN